MNLWKRAVLFLTRRRRKTAILLAVLTVSASLALICQSAGNACESALRSLRETMGGYFKLETDIYDGYMGILTSQMLTDISSIDGIREYNDIDVHLMVADNFSLLPGHFAAEGGEQARTARFIGSSDSSLSEYFLLDYLTLTEGRHIIREDSFQAVISETLAEQNHIGIGDSLTVHVTAEDLPANLKGQVFSYTYEVVGIFRNNSLPSASADAEYNMVENFIFTDAAAPKIICQEALGVNQDVYRQGASFFVEDPQSMDAIVEAVCQLPGYNWETFKLTENNVTYDRVAAPLERISGLSRAAVAVVLAVSGIIVALIFVMWMRERLPETGVLLSIGIGKGSLILQHLAENLLVCVVSLLLAWGVAGLASGGIDSFLVQGDMSGETAQEDAADFGVFENTLPEQEVDTGTLVAAGAGADVFLPVAGWTLLIVAAATGVSSILILRTSPKKLLSLMS